MNEGNEYWEEVFGQALEDASTYLYAVGAFRRPPEGVDHDYLLLLMLMSRARSHRAMAMLGGAPGEYAPYTRRIDKLVSRADDAFARLVEEQGRRIPDMVNDSFTARVDRIQTQVAGLADLSRRACLAESENREKESRRELAHDTMVRAAMVANAASALRGVAELRQGTGRFLRAVHRLEDVFAVHAGEFEIAGDLYPALVERDYDARCWWAPGTVGETEALPEITPALALAYAAGLAAGECGMTEKVVSAVFDGDTTPELDDHLEQCPHCATMATDLLAAREEAARALPAPAMSPELAGAVHAMASKRPENIGGILEKVRGLARRLFPSGGAIPKFAPVAAMAVLVLVVVQFGLVGGDAPDPAENNTVARKAAAPEQSPAMLTLFGAQNDGAVFRGAAWNRERKELDKGSVLRSGEDFQVGVTMNEPSHVYVLLHDSAGKIQPLHQGRMEKGEQKLLPDRDMWYTLDKHQGKENIYLLAADKPVEDFDEKIARLEWYGMEEMRRFMPDVRVISTGFEHR
ncbi:MAG: DUF4384 domain-containing protein [Desulfatibacillaceae bacterium]